MERLVTGGVLTVCFGFLMIGALQGAQSSMKLARDMTTTAQQYRERLVALRSIESSSEKETKHLSVLLEQSTQSARTHFCTSVIRGGFGIAAFFAYILLLWRCDVFASMGTLKQPIRARAF